MYKDLIRFSIVAVIVAFFFLLNSGRTIVSADSPTDPATVVVKAADESTPTETSAPEATEAPAATATEAPPSPTKAIAPSETPTEEATSVPPTATPKATATTAPKATATETAEATATEAVPATEVATPTETLTPAATAVVTATATLTPTTAPTPTKTPVRKLSPRAATYDSSQSTKVYVMNMGTTPADVAVQYYDSDGNPVASDPSCTSVPANGRCVFNGSALASPFKGSGVISSTEPVAAMARIIGSTYGTLADYTGKAQGAGDTSLFLPSVHRSTWQTQVAAQNMGSAATQIDMAVRNPAGAVVATESIPNVQPNETAYFDLVNDAAFSALGTSFAGSATLNGNGQPLAAIVMENSTQHGGKYAYPGFSTTDGGTTIYFPSLHRNRAADYAGTGWNSSSFIQNLDTVNPVTVLVTWIDGSDAGGGVAKQASYNIPAGTSQYLTTYYEPSNRNGWAGSMKVVITSGTGPIVGISSEIYQKGGSASNPVISAYDEYHAVNAGVYTIYSPIGAGHWNGSANTGDYARHFVQNLSTSQIAQVTGAWLNPTTGATVFSLSVNISPGSSYYFSPNRQSSGSGMWNFTGTFMATSTNSVPIAGLSYDSTLGSSPGEAGYTRDTTGMFNMPGQ